MCGLDISNPEYLHIEGNIYNQEFTAFQEDLRGLGTPSEKVLVSPLILILFPLSRYMGYSIWLLISRKAGASKKQ